MKPNKSVFFVTRLAICIILLTTVGTQPIGARANDATCSLNAFPVALQKKILAEFSSWKIQELGDLSLSAKARWHSANYLGCPGIAAGEFRENGQESYATLLVPREKPDSAYRLVIYSLNSANHGEEFRIVDTDDSLGASNFFLHVARTDKLFDGPSRRKFHIGTNDSVLLFDAGKTEYEVDAYYWSEGEYRSSPIDM